MLSRRRFLGSSLATAVVSSSARSGLALPSALEELPDLSKEARPFTSAERLHRIDKAKELMRQYRLDAIVLPSGSSAMYFANLKLGGSERLWALTIPVRGAPFLVCPAFEEERAHQVLKAGPLARDGDVQVWQEDQSPYELLLRALKARGIAVGRLGLDESTPFVFADGIRHAAGSQFQILSATPVTAGCRMIKDAHEIECLRLASKATLLVYRAVYRSLREGMTQKDVLSLIDAGYARVGFHGEASVNVGTYTALPHGSAEPQIIREGTIVMLDDGCQVEGYWSDITRTFVLGKPSNKMQQVFEIVRQAQAAALQSARPGVACEAVDRAARQVITNAGYGPGFRYFSHRVGHGLGMDMHEWNYLVPNNMYGWVQNPVLEAGMVFSDEPGVYLKGEFGIRLEDDMHITANGAELLTAPSRSLEQPFD